MLSISITNMVDKVVELYNGLYLTIRKVKESIMKQMVLWCDNLHNHIEGNEKKIELLMKRIEILEKKLDC